MSGYQVCLENAYELGGRKSESNNLSGDIVKDEWIDYNGHLNMAFYNVLFDKGVDFFYDRIGVGEEYTRSGVGSVFTLEVHLQYLRGIKPSRQSTSPSAAP